MAPLTNVPIMSEISIQLFKHLEYQNLFIISGDIGRASLMQNFLCMEERRNGQPPVLYRIVVFNINFKNIINNIKTTLLNVFLYISDVENLSLID